jgi:ABC-2 type transport system permease protein
MREAWALVRAQWHAALSYRMRMAMSLLSVLVTVVPVYFVATALQPTMARAISAEGGQYFGFLVAGTVTLVYLTSAVGTLPGAIGGGISTGTWDALLATPAPRWALLAGLSGYDFLWSTVKGGALLLAASLLGARIAWEGALLAAAILGLIVLAYLPVGLMAAASVLAFRTRSPLPQAALVASVFLGGVYYPTGVIPGWLQELSALVPLTYGLRALRQALLEGRGIGAVLPDLEMLLLFDAVLLAAGAAAFQWALRHARRHGTTAQY